MEDDEQLFRTARRAAVAALAAELGHDLHGPTNLFRLAADRMERGERLDAEDLSLVREELARLSALSARLRQLAQQPLVKQPWAPQVLVQQALGARARALDPALELELPAPDRCTIHCDAALLGLALSELIENALAARARRAGVRFAVDDRPSFCVWDDGPGFEQGEGAALAWGASTKPGAAGLGLTIALRAARAHGFGLHITRAAGLTEVRLSIPAREVQAGTTKLGT
jgi:signal transduction histidine kinase